MSRAGMKTVLLVIIGLATVCRVDADLSEDENAYRFGKELTFSTEGAKMSNYVELLPDEIIEGGRLFAYSAFFRRTYRVVFQVWRPTGEQDSFKLMAQTPYTPKHVNRIPLKVYLDKCVHVVAGDRIGAFMVGERGALAFRPSGDLQMRYQLLKLSGGDQSIGDVYYFKAIHSPYDMSMAAYINTDMSDVKIDPSSVYVQCPPIENPLTDASAPELPRQSVDNNNTDWVCSLSGGVCTSGRCRRKHRPWPNICSSANKCCVKGHSRHVHCIEMGGRCLRRADSTSYVGHRWPSMCSRSAKVQCYIRDSLPTDYECIRRGGLCVWLNDTRWSSLCGDHQLGPYCGDQQSQRVCCRKNAKQDETCHLSGGACRNKKFSCWGGDYWAGKCGADQRRSCCILGSRPRDTRCVADHNGECLASGSTCKFGRFHADSGLCGASTGRRCCVAQTEQTPTTTAPPVSPPDCGPCPCLAATGDWPGNMADRIVSEARSHLDSRMWSVQSGHRSAKGQLKGDMFVAEVLEAVGAGVPHRDWWRWSPIGTDEWFQPYSVLLLDSCWYNVDGDPHPGDVISNDEVTAIVTDINRATHSDSQRVNEFEFVHDSARQTIWRMNCSCDHFTENKTITTTTPASTTATIKSPSHRQPRFVCERHLGVRLTSNDGNPAKGLVELYHDGDWGTLCKNETGGMAEGDVLCRMMGFSSARTYGWGDSDTPIKDNADIMLSGMKCETNETSIYDCKHSEWKNVLFLCDHELDAALHCNGEISPVTNAMMNFDPNAANVIRYKPTDLPLINTRRSSIGTATSGCVATQYEQKPWMTLDLQDVYDISHIWIQLDEDTMHDIDIEVAIADGADYTKCAQIVGTIPHSDVAAQAERFLQCCDKPAVGRYLRLIGRQSGIIAFCELFIYGVKYV